MTTEIEQVIARAQEWYSTHGWILLAARSERSIGHVHRNNTGHPIAEKMARLGKVAVVGTATLAEANAFAKFCGDWGKWPAEQMYFYKCEALPD